MTLGPASVDVLLCDADGNLFPSEEPAFVASATVTNAFLAAHGVDVRFEPDVLRLTTTGKNFRTTLGDLASAYGIRVDPEEVEHWVAEERAAVTAHLSSTLQPDEAVLGPLRRFAERYVLAAVSSSATSRLAACFAATGIDALIPPDHCFSAEDSLPVPTSKPDPAIYRHACNALSIDPQAAVAIEDSVPGARAAIAAGVPTIGNVQFVPDRERFEREQLLLACGVTAVVTSWSEFEGLLAERAGG